MFESNKILTIDNNLSMRRIIQVRTVDSSHQPIEIVSTRYDDKNEAEDFDTIKLTVSDAEVLIQFLIAGMLDAVSTKASAAQ